MLFIYIFYPEIFNSIFLTLMLYSLIKKVVYIMATDKATDVFIATGKDIPTRHGCTCKNEYTWNSDGVNKTFKETCNTISNKTDPWCIVEDNCGLQALDDKQWWDHCNPPAEELVDSSWTVGNKYYINSIIGFVIYIVIFVITVPMLLYKYSSFTLLEAYLPNLDLLATSISFDGGPGKSTIFQSLYMTTPSSWFSFGTTTLINYLALLGLTYLVARKVMSTGSLIKGWSIGFIMLLLTYLIPNQIITTIQDKLAPFLREKYGLDRRKGPSVYLIVIGISLAISAGFILVERFILNNHQYLIDPLVNSLSKLKFFQKT